MTVRRARQHPAEFGRSSTFVMTIELPQIEALSERFRRRLNYHGMVELEYKHDSRDGQFKLLDVNGGTWGYHPLGRRARVDFAHMLYTDQIGSQVQPCRAQAGLSWIRLITDAPTAVLDILCGRLNWRAHAQSLRISNIESVFDSGDPFPGIAELPLIPYLAIERGF
jgi:D-aspartate ligase